MNETQSSDHRTEPLVSVVIPCYNHGQYVGDAIRSVFDQTYPNYEIIVVDDGSQDNTQAAIEIFGKGVRYIWQENQGLSAARNTGIKASNGELIGLLDADDMYEPNYLRSMLSELLKNPSAAGVICGYQYVNENNDSLPQVMTRITPPNELFSMLLQGNYLVPESILLHKRCYDRVGLFDCSLSACEDWDMWLRISRDFEIISTDQILTRHRILTGSMSSDPLRMLKNRIAVLDKHFNTLPKNTQYAQSEVQLAYGMAYLAASTEYLQFGDLEKGYSCFRKMSLIYPRILMRLEPIYELALGNQPKGYRGHFKSLDISKNSQILFSMMDKLFSDPQLSSSIYKYYKIAYTNAYFAIGLLNYGAHNFRETRRYFNKIIILNPRYCLQTEYILKYIKSLLGKQIIQYAKHIRQGRKITVNNKPLQS